LLAGLRSLSPILCAGIGLVLVGLFLILLWRRNAE
jgi:hypothetical protein